MRRNKGGINRLGRETSAVLAALAEKLTEETDQFVVG